MIQTTGGRALDMTPAPKVLICSVDGGWFGIRTDWVEAVIPRAGISEQSIRVPGQKPQPFLLYQGEAALVVDLDTLVGLGDSSRASDRDQLMLVRAGEILIAVPVDNCVGIRAIDLHSRAPVPSRIRRDSGLPIGHLVEMDGRMLMVLDPARLLGSREHGLWATAERRADGIRRRQVKLESLWSEIRSEPSAAAIRSYASLCSRAGRTAAATAARTVLSYFTADEGAANATSDHGSEEVIRQLLQLGNQRRTGRLVVDANGSGEADLQLIEGRVVAARHANRHGRAAVTNLLATPCLSSRFIESGSPTTDTPGDSPSAAALLIEALEAGVPDRRKRRNGVA